MILVMYSNFSPSASHIAALNELGGGREVRVIGNEADAMALAAHAEILLGHRYLRQVLPFAVNLRWVQSTAGGIDLLRAPELLNRHITLCRCMVNADCVAHHALAMGWALIRGLPLAFQAQSRGDYTAPRSDLPLPATAVVIGLGDIGRQLAGMLRGLGLYVKGVARSASFDQLNACDHFFPADRFRDALPSSDLCFLTLPLDDVTRGLIGAAELALLPPHAVLVSVTRSAVVDLNALTHALRSGRLAGAGLDGLDPVPPQNSDFWTTPGLLVTPKLAAYHSGMQNRIERFVEAQLERYVLDSGRLLGVVSRATQQASFTPEYK